MYADIQHVCRCMQCLYHLNYYKYQGVKEFHMLARIGCYCKIMVFSPLKLEVTYYHSFKAIKP